MKLVVEISEEDYERFKVYKKAPFCSLTSRVYEAIANGKPLDEVLNKIRAEIVEMRSKQNCSCSDCLDIIDKYKAESEG